MKTTKRPGRQRGPSPPGAAAQRGARLPAGEQPLRAWVERNPGDADAWLQLAALTGRQGRPTEAAKCAQQVIRINPQHPAAHSLLGNILAQLRQPQSALHHLQRALELDPRDAAAANTLGSLLRDLGRFADAVACLTRAVELQPTNLPARFLLADAYQHRGMRKEARTVLKGLLAFPQAAAESHLSLGRLDVVDGELQRALDHFAAALALDPGNRAALSGMAAAEVKLGHKDRGYALVRGLIDRGVADALALDSYATICREFGDCREATDLITRLLRQAQLQPVERSLLGFALGRLHEATGDYDEAFRCFAEANEVALPNFEPGAYTSFVTQIVDSYPQDRVREFATASVQHEEPIFIVGMARSGTSLAEQILSRHSAVHAAGELSYVPELASGLRNELGPAFVYPVGAAALSVAQLDELAGRHLGRLRALAPEAPRITDKMPSNFLFLGLLAQIFPRARFINCVRDPRDVCLSIYFQHFRANQPFASRLEHIAQAHNDYARLMQHWESLALAPIHHLCYEDLVQEPEAEVRAVLEFLGLEWQDECLDFHLSRRTVNTASNDQVRRPLYQSSVARWRRYEKHLEPILGTLGPALAYFAAHRRTS